MFNLRHLAVHKSCKPRTVVELPSASSVGCTDPPDCRQAALPSCSYLEGFCRPWGQVSATINAMTRQTQSSETQVDMARGPCRHQLCGTHLWRAQWADRPLRGGAAYCRIFSVISGFGRIESCTLEVSLESQQLWLWCRQSSERTYPPHSAGTQTVSTLRDGQTR